MLGVKIRHELRPGCLLDDGIVISYESFLNAICSPHARIPKGTPWELIGLPCLSVPRDYSYAFSGKPTTE